MNFGEIFYFVDNFISLSLLIVLLGILLNQIFKRKNEKLPNFIFVVFLIILMFFLDILFYVEIISFNFKIYYSIVTVVLTFYFVFLCIKHWKFADKLLFYLFIIFALLLNIFDYFYTFREEVIYFVLRSLFSIFTFIFIYFLIIKFIINFKNEKK